MIAIGTGIALFLIVCVALFERVRGARQLRDVLGRLDVLKVELDPAKIANDPVPEAENIVTALLQITNELQSFSLPQDVPSIPLMKITAPGEAQSFLNLESWEGPEGKPFRWEQLADAHSKALVLFDKLAEISKRPRFASQLDFSKGTADMELHGLAGLTPVMRVLRLIAAYDLHHGNDERAAEAVVTLLNIFPAKSEDNWNFVEMMRWSYTRLGMSLTWELLQNATLTDETWRRLQTTWERCHFIDLYAKAARMEVAGMSDYFLRLNGSRAYQKNIIGKFEQIEREFGATWNPLVRGEVLRRIHLPAWDLIWAGQDYAFTMRRYETELHLAEFARSNSWNATREEARRHGRPNEGMEGNLDSRNIYDRARFLFSFPPEPILKVDLSRAFRAETEASLAIAAIALERYSITHENYPANLEELVPRYLPALPKDPMDGAPLKYRLLDEGGYRLYSSGLDGQDDGGEEEHDDAKSGGTLWTAKDVVWPRQIAP